MPLGAIRSIRKKSEASVFNLLFLMPNRAQAIYLERISPLLSITEA
jgi:hypothetical protein